MLLDEELYARLSWRGPADQRRDTIESLVANPDQVDLATLMKPARRKDVWAAAADVVSRIGRPRIDAHLPALLEWLQDMNWPGARTIFDVLKDMDASTLLPAFRSAVERARVEKDEIWEEYLGALADARGDLRGDCGPWTPLQA